MASQRVSDMTLEELTDLIDERIRRVVPLKRKDKRSMSELLAILDKHRIIPPPGAKSAREMLREDRDS